MLSISFAQIIYTEIGFFSRYYYCNITQTLLKFTNHWQTFCNKLANICNFFGVSRMRKVRIAVELDRVPFFGQILCSGSAKSKCNNCIFLSMAHQYRDLLVHFRAKLAAELGEPVFDQIQSMIPLTVSNFSPRASHPLHATTPANGCEVETAVKREMTHPTQPVQYLD